MVTFQGTSDAGQGTSDAGTIAVGIIVAGVLLVGGFNLIPWRLIKYSAWKREVERAKSNVPVSL
jgi:hypothetical protein